MLTSWRQLTKKDLNVEWLYVFSVQWYLRKKHKGTLYSNILTAGSPISIDFMHICRGFLLKLPVHLNIQSGFGKIVNRKTNKSIIQTNSREVYKTDSWWSVNNLYTRLSVRKICYNMGFLWLAYFLYGNIQVRENPYSGIFYAVFYHV